PDALILAVEPDKNNLAMMCRNTAEYRNVRLVEGAVWSSETEVVIENPDALAWAIRVVEAAPGGNGVRVRGYTIESLMDLAGVDEIFILKVDIEGSEQTLFRCNSGWLEKTAVLMVELHDWMFPGERR